MFIKSKLEKIIPIKEEIYRDFDFMKIDIDEFCKNNDRNFLRYEEPIRLRYGFVDIETGKSFVMSLSYHLGSLRSFNDYIEHYCDIALYNKNIVNFIKKHPNSVCWETISSRYNLSKEFIQKFYNKLDFNRLMDNKNTSDEIKDFCKMFL